MTTIKIEAGAGDHIADVFGRAVAAAAKSGNPAEFTFSGATVQVDAASSYETTWAEIHRQWKAEADAYAAIPKGIKAAAKAAAEQKAEHKKPDIMARYIAGQALSTMASNLPPHPVSMTIIGEEYLAMIGGKP